MAIVSMKELLEAGVHFGHRRRRWNPKMKPFIFTERKGIHIIDLQQTLSRLEAAYNVTRETVGNGGIVLFVGTKKQAQDTIAEEATRCNMPFVNQRWLGGTLTNFRTIRQRIEYMEALERRFESGDINRLTKKEILLYQRELEKLHVRFGGLRKLTRLPDLLFVVDVKREEIGIKEARTLGIPVIAMVDTNCDPDPVDYVIPSNDDAIRAIRLMTSKIADAVLEGLAIRSTMEAEEEAAREAQAAAEAARKTQAEEAGELEYTYEDEDERLLGESTLAKLRSGLFAGEDDEDATEEHEVEELEDEFEAEDVEDEEE
ncbi:MAG: 30S ribosomal protein S2 [Chloroflexi bacterium]|nr:30S ribosomal protein S2 [Chloroflexota bacterium]